MKYALNTKKGTVINHPKIGKLHGGVATPVSEHDANQLKHITGVVVFDEVKVPEKKEKFINEVVAEERIME